MVRGIVRVCVCDERTSMIMSNRTVSNKFSVKIFESLSFLDSYLHFESFGRGKKMCTVVSFHI